VIKGFTDTLLEIFKPSNIGSFVFFTLNLSLILFMFSPYSFTLEGAAILIASYIASVAISLSPAGEGVLSIFAGAKEIKRKDMKIKLIPLLEIVYGNAKRESPDMVCSIHLKIISGNEQNAYALGRRTICVTEGLLDLPDNLILGILAHEIGHIANKHSEIQLFIGGANVLISGFLLFLKLIAWCIVGIFGLFALAFRRSGLGCILGALSAFPAMLIFLWTKLCMLFLQWPARSNEFVADEYAFQIGFGKELAQVLDNCNYETANHFMRVLYSSHPSANERIARLQDLGVNYSRW